MQFYPYRLPDGRIVLCDASATKGARVIDFTLAGGSIVLAVLVEPEPYKPFEPRKDAEPLHAFGVRTLIHAMQHYIFDDVETEAIALAIHCSTAMHTAATTDAITAAVVRLRRELADRERCQAAPVAEPVAAAATLPGRPGGDGGARVPVSPPIPRRPSPAVANPF